jgi:uncharacterized caspase-like protein
MKRLSKIFSVLAILACIAVPERGAAAVPEKRFALVIGNAAYKAQPLITAVNDAALISQTLQLAGFDVIGGRDLDQNQLHEAVRAFTNKVANVGADAVAFVYFAGYGGQLAGDNYLIPVGAEISELADLPARALSLAELMHALSALNPKSTFIVLDAGRPGPFVMAGQAGGLAWTEPEANMLIAFGTAPGTMARDTAGSYGAYARALAEMIREGDLTPVSLFDRVRLRVHELTGGGQVPWNASKIETSFKFFERTPAAAERSDAAARTAQFRWQPMRALGAQGAYTAALLRDTFDAYADFLADYWQDPMTKRIRALLAARRESITWERTCQANEPVAYWSYLERYPSGPHAAEASRLLTRTGAATTPPAKFARMDYDVPPPLPDELEYIERPLLILNDPSFGFESPPPTPANFLEPAPQQLLNLKPPAASQGHSLPVLNLPLLASIRVPPAVRAPSNPLGDGREAWAMKPAIDVPNGQQKQADSSSASSLALPNGATSRGEGASPARGGAGQNNTPSAQSGNQVATKETTPRMASLTPTASPTPQWLANIAEPKNDESFLRAPASDGEVSAVAPSMFAPASPGLTFEQRTLGAWPQSQPLTSSEILPLSANRGRSDQNEGILALNAKPQTAATMPAWLTDLTTARKSNVTLRPSTIGSDMPVSGPSMFASASAGLTFQTWRYGLPRWSVRASLPVPRRASLPPPQGVLSSAQSSAAAPISHATGNSPRSTRRGGSLAPAVSESTSKPGADPLAPPLATNQAKPHARTSTINPDPSRDPNEPGAAAPAGSQ